MKVFRMYFSKIIFQKVEHEDDTKILILIDSSKIISTSHLTIITIRGKILNLILSIIISRLFLM